jgi:hypothetical protein
MPKKLESIRKAIKKENPNMSESRAYAIATDTYKKTSEGKKWAARKKK